MSILNHGTDNMTIKVLNQIKRTSQTKVHFLDLLTKNRLVYK